MRNDHNASAEWAGRQFTYVRTPLEMGHVKCPLICVNAGQLQEWSTTSLQGEARVGSLHFCMC